MLDGSLVPLPCPQVPRLYRALMAAGPSEVQAATAIVAGRPCVWVGNQFVAPDRVAFKVGGLEERIALLTL